MCSALHLTALLNPWWQVTPSQPAKFRLVTSGAVDEKETTILVGKPVWGVLLACKCPSLNRLLIASRSDIQKRHHFCKVWTWLPGILPAEKRKFSWV